MLEQPGPDGTAGSIPGQPATPGPEPAPPAGSSPAERLDPQKLLRIAGVTREVLEEARRIRPEPGAVEHIRHVHEQIRQELREALPTPLYEELDELTPAVRAGTLEELALAHAEILGWLEGLFQGTQLALQLQAAHAAQQAMAERVGRPLPPGTGEAEGSDSRYL